MKRVKSKMVASNSKYGIIANESFLFLEKIRKRKAPKWKRDVV